MIDTTKQGEKPRKPRWRWWSFSLRGLLVATVVCGFGLGWVARQMKHHDRQVQAYREVDTFMFIKDWAPPDWLVWLGLGSSVRRFDVAKRAEVYVFIPAPDFSPSPEELEQYKFAFRTLLEFPDVEVVEFVDCFPSTHAKEMEAVAKHPSLRSVKFDLHYPAGQQAKAMLMYAKPSLKIVNPDYLRWQSWDEETEQFMPYGLNLEGFRKLTKKGSNSTANSPMPVPQNSDEEQPS